MTAVSRVFVHIGPLKTGTTFIQTVLYGNRDTLLEQGVVLPRDNFGLHVRSVLGLMGRRMHPDGTDQDSRQWRLLVDEVKAADAHTAVISMEFLCTASARAVRRLVDTMAPIEVHVIYTARDLVKVIPAAWQTLLRNKQAPPWDGWLSSVREVAREGAPRRSGKAAARRLLGRNPDPRTDTWGSRLWRQQDPRQVLAPYLEHVPAERVHVVTVPPPGAPASLLWERFCAATGMDAAAYDIDVPRANVSLGGVECEVLRRVNQGVAGRIPGSVYGDLVKHFLAREVLEQRTQSFPLVLPEAERAWAAERAADAIAYFGSGGFRVHGDLADLVAAPPPTGRVRAPDDVSEAEVLAVMQDTLSAVLLEMTRRQGLEAYDGPRSDEEPLPAPEALGLTGEPPGPGTRQDAQARPARAGEPAAIADRGADPVTARRRARRARKAAGMKAAGKRAAGKRSGGKRPGGKRASPPPD